MNNLFEVKQHDHCLRDGTRLLQPKVRTTQGLRTISYLGAKLWNDLPVHMKSIHHMDPYKFKSMLLLWQGPRSILHLSMLCVICWIGTKFPSLAEVKNIYIYVFYYFYRYVNLYEYDMYIWWCFICWMHPFGLCRAEAGIQCSSDARLGSVQIRVIPHFFLYICVLLLYILHFVLYCTIYLSHTSPWLMLLVISCDNK